MLTVVFHRLETDDPSTLPPPIVVADVLSKQSGGGKAGDGTSIFNFLRMGNHD